MALLVVKLRTVGTTAITLTGWHIAAVVIRANCACPCLLSVSLK